eukprot:Opistho-1_new@61987
MDAALARRLVRRGRMPCDDGLGLGKRQVQRHRPHSHPGRAEGLGHRCAARLQGPAAGTRHGGPGAGPVGGQVCRLPRRVRRVERGLRSPGRRHDEGRYQDRPRGPPARPELPGPHDDDEGLAHLHPVGLHQPRHALDGAQEPQARRGLCGDGLPALAGRCAAGRWRAVRPEHRRGAAAAAQPQGQDDGTCAVARRSVRQGRQARCAGFGLHEELPGGGDHRLLSARLRPQCAWQSGPAAAPGRPAARARHPASACECRARGADEQARVGAVESICLPGLPPDREQGGRPQLPRGGGPVQGPGRCARVLRSSAQERQQRRLGFYPHAAANPA